MPSLAISKPAFRSIQLRSSLTPLILLLLAGCSAPDISGVDFGLGKGWPAPCTSGPRCDEVRIYPASGQYLLLGDTIRVSAITVGLKNDNFQWQTDGTRLAFVGVGAGESSTATGATATLRALSEGSGQLTATRLGDSLSVTFNVIPPDSLRPVTITRLHDATPQAMAAWHSSAVDTLVVGSSSSLISIVTDRAGHDVAATITWSSSDTTVARIAYSGNRSNYSNSGWKTVAVGTGTTVITASGLGIKTSFELNVVSP